MDATPWFYKRWWTANVALPIFAFVGRVKHDARVFRNSELYHKGMQGNLLTSTRNISDAEVPVILGEPAYPLVPWLMKPNPGHALSRQRTTFNFKHSSTRMATEIAFGRLNGRWRWPLKRLDNRLVNIPTIVEACVLHNFCELHIKTLMMGFQLLIGQLMNLR